MGGKEGKSEIGFMSKMMCEGLRIVQTITVKEEKKTVLKFGSQVREQLRSSQASDSRKHSQMLTNLYEPITPAD